MAACNPKHSTGTKHSKKLQQEWQDLLSLSLVSKSKIKTSNRKRHQNLDFWVLKFVHQKYVSPKFTWIGCCWLVWGLQWAWSRLSWFAITGRSRGSIGTMARPELLAIGRRWVALGPFAPLRPITSNCKQEGSDSFHLGASELVRLGGIAFSI